MMDVIFITGIHGVGKTTLCAQFTTRTAIPFFSASQLIKSIQPESIDASRKNVRNIENNQSLLLQAIGAKLEKFHTIILDGHSTLLDSQGNIQRLPLGVFEAMPIQAVCCVYEEPRIIVERLLARDNRPYDLPMIEYYQKIELDHSADIAKHLGIPFQTVTSNQSDLFFEILLNWSQSEPGVNNEH